jgi:tripartite ATP-independent transporter DctP family solute receptor
MRKTIASLACVLTSAVLLAAMPAMAQTKHFSFGYDQPHTTGYGVAGDLFNAKLSELSKGTMVTDQFPGAQLGQEPQMLQKIRTGDIDFIITSTANSATLEPQSGMLSVHYIFKSEAHLVKALAMPEMTATVREMFSTNVTGARVLAMATLGLRNLYSKKEIRTLADIKGLKVRVQATATEDAIFPAYGAQTVHMPFGNVYTSLQTGVVDVAENSVNVYLANKHYETAPVMSMTEHEANNSVIWVSDKVWNSLTPEQQGWVQAAATEVSTKQPAKALELERDSLVRLKKLGVKIVEDVNKAQFAAVAKPMQDELAKGLGPYAVKILAIARAAE